MKWIKKIFSRKPKALLIDNKYRIVPAFEWRGEVYYMHEDPMNVSTGRGLLAMVHLEELLMRCTADYLRDHVEAVENIFKDGQRIDLPRLMRLNYNLKERLNFLVAVPDQVYKLASVVFFTKDESPFKYDKAYNEAKIAAWKEAPDMYDFFLQTPLKTLLPFLTLPESDTRGYLAVQEKISSIHLRELREALSSSPLSAAMKN